MLEQEGVGPRGVGDQSSDTLAETSVMLPEPCSACPHGSSSRRALKAQGLGGEVDGARSISLWKTNLQPAAWKLETLVSASLLRAPWFLPKTGALAPASEGTDRGQGWCPWT